MFCLVLPGRVRVRICLFLPLFDEEWPDGGEEEEEEEDEDNEDRPGVVRRKSFSVTSHFPHLQAGLMGLRRSLEPSFLSPTRRRSRQAG